MRALYGDMPAPFPWAPPLPFVNEFLNLVAFAVEDLDDCAEDILKLIILAVACVCARYPVARICLWMGLEVAVLRWFSRAAVVAAVCVVYPVADQLSDSLARYPQILQDSLGATLGMPPPEPEQSDISIPYNVVVDSVDDVVEDVFKAACVFSHYTMGALLGGTMRRIIAGWVVHVDGSVGARYTVAAGNAASTLVVVGTPAGRYSKCDRFGDKLGDQVQRALIDWLNVVFVE